MSIKIGNGKLKKKLDWDLPVQYLKGVGPRRSQLLAKLGIVTLEDLIYYFPRAYEDRSHWCQIKELKPGQMVTVKGMVLSVNEWRSRRGLNLLKVTIGDDSGLLYLLWFNQPFRRGQFIVGQEVIVSGEVEMKRELQILNPNYEILSHNEEDLIHTGRIVPLYSLTGNLTPRILRTIIKEALDTYASQVPDFLPSFIRQRHYLPDLSWAIYQIHFPENFGGKEKARRRLVFDEFFILQLYLAMKKKTLQENARGISHHPDENLLKKFYRNLPFSLTVAQKRVINEIKQDMESFHPMNRLIQGDVGSGKTVVAVVALLIAVGGSYQGALMVPTEILAEQHYLTLLPHLSPLGIRITLLTGSMKRSERQKALTEIKNGETDVVVGTHALIQEGVEFHRLGLTIIDEQHRFGVMQRALLREKGLNPDVLVMTATPIPRSLALTVYGDLCVSIIDELPPGRQPISTYWINPRKRPDLYQFIRKQVAEERQIYVVYPLIEESEILDVAAATKMAEHFQEEVFPDLRVGLLHGRLPTEEKEAVMRAFKNRGIDILVATSVIEVGIDIPNATVMVIEDADRFGLAQLHQLRGRVGRGEHPSYCILISNPSSEEGKRRMQVLTKLRDGFAIAEEDLKLRGPGEFFGTRQHGLPDLRIAHIINDVEILELARREAFRLIETDSRLENLEYLLLREVLKRKFVERLSLISVG